MSGRDSLTPFALIGLGTSTAALVLAGMALGYWIGESVGQTLLLTLAGLLVGIGCAVLAVWAKFKRYT